ncbi:fam-a protein [Plasmodium chabaudi chabaudi]|uniref:Fam-a protein n=1 Tax=Plasmodium chabaudi chabaudi TaxID=31271 RepID=A0A4V0KCV6_PLACU|nr:fam-a protein [Plasmodium chabaudi chabaudi]VTZ70657.1 fam-a protein [Plasmodium chabaudi chabaudi]|eukprot:XP_016654774.1 fam-a protein [Plasmodium chabaudi chabaudi]
MKGMPLGLISSIIFSAVLVRVSSCSKPITGYFPLHRKKTKKSHTTTNKPVKVKGKGAYDPDLPDLKFIDEFDPMLMEIYKKNQTELDELFISEADGTNVDKVAGFLRRENESRRKRWYIRPYEENYEDMIKDIYAPLKNNYQYNQITAHKQGCTAVALPNAPENQVLNTLHEDAELDEGVASFLGDGENDEIYEKTKHLLCTNPEEIIKASELMNEAIEHLEYHATDIDNYETWIANNCKYMFFYKKKHKGHTNVEKIQYTVYGSNKYNEVINKLWNPDQAQFLNTISVKRKIVRVYNPNLVIIQQRYKKDSMEREEYFYALVKKAQISKDTTIIVMTSANINDHNPSGTKYKNTIIENANLFTTDIDSEDDIRSGKLKKTFVNIAGSLIQNKSGHVNVTYVESIIFSFIYKHIFIYIFQHHNIRKFKLIKRFISMHNGCFKLLS